MMRNRIRLLGFAFVILSSAAPRAVAQDWTFTTDANAFFGYNYQQRKFADFSAWESQNWFMLDGTRELDSGRLSLLAMISLEPLTVDAAGSPQLFQTGESYKRQPLSNNQHPHDLFMELGGAYRIERPQLAYLLGVYLVGSPALGPTPFMHRESARDNPQVPLSHHYLDSTHISYGVLTAGVQTGPFTFETSAFRGAEPDENRYNIETPRLDSYSGRIGWKRGPWQAQFSAGHLRVPEWFEPYDETRLTASIGFDGAIRSRPLSALLAWGQNRQAIVKNGVSDMFLTEWDLRATPMTVFYGRAEVGEKEILGLGYHPFGFSHPHLYSHIDTLTLGVVRDVVNGSTGRFGIGADVTLYHMSPD